MRFCSCRHYLWVAAFVRPPRPPPGRGGRRLCGSAWRARPVCLGLLRRGGSAPPLRARLLSLPPPAPARAAPAAALGRARPRGLFGWRGCAAPVIRGARLRRVGYMPAVPLRWLVLPPLAPVGGVLPPCRLPCLRRRPLPCVRSPRAARGGAGCAPVPAGACAAALSRSAASPSLVRAAWRVPPARRRQGGGGYAPAYPHNSRRAGEGSKARGQVHARINGPSRGAASGACRPSPRASRASRGSARSLAPVASRPAPRAAPPGRTNQETRAGNFWLPIKSPQALPAGFFWRWWMLSPVATA